MKKNKVVLFVIGLIVAAIFVFKFVDRFASVNLVTKTCLITGASSGIGQHLAIEMVKRGWKVIGVARRAELLNQLREQLGEESFIPFVCDVSNPEQIHTVSQTIKSQGLQPTLFFLNAGIAEPTSKWENVMNTHQKTFAINYFGTIAWIDEWLLPVKQLGGGTFVAISSIYALLAAQRIDAYAASKIALVHSFSSFNRQYFYDNIGFSTVLSGPVATAMLKGHMDKDLLFTHQPDQEALYIIDQVFKGKKQIEPSLVYATLFRIINFLPDIVAVKVFGS